MKKDKIQKKKKKRKWRKINIQSRIINSFFSGVEIKMIPGWIENPIYFTWILCSKHVYIHSFFPSFIFFCLKTLTSTSCIAQCFTWKSFLKKIFLIYWIIQKRVKRVSDLKYHSPSSLLGPRETLQPIPLSLLVISLLSNIILFHTTLPILVRAFFHQSVHQSVLAYSKCQQEHSPIRLSISPSLLAPNVSKSVLPSVRLSVRPCLLLMSARAFSHPSVYQSVHACLHTHSLPISGIVFSYPCVYQSVHAYSHTRLLEYMQATPFPRNSSPVRRNDDASLSV